jgi:hypothetical protein
MNIEKVKLASDIFHVVIFKAELGRKGVAGPLAVTKNNK